MNLDRIKNNTTISDTGCWEWQKSCNSAGYGQLTENKKYWSAHRYAYACKNTLSDGDVVRHTCHNRKCCNPEHLKIGTHKDNWEDSKDLHLESASKRRKKWTINGTKYSSVREASQRTGLHQGTIIKYTTEGVFDINSYLAGCKKANVAPKL